MINELKKAAQSLGISSLSSYHLEYKERQQKLLRALKKVSVHQCKIAIQLILCCNRIILNAIYTKYCDLSIGPTHASSIRIGTPNTTNETPTATSGSTQWDVPIFPANAVLSTGPFLLELLNWLLSSLSIYLHVIFTEIYRVIKAQPVDPNWK